MADSVSIRSGGRKNGRSSQFIDCLHSGDTDYAATTGLDVSTNTFEPTYIITGLIIGEGSGNIAIEMENGGVMTIPFNISEEQSSMRVFDGYRIAKIFNVAGGTSFDGNIWPVW